MHNDSFRSAAALMLVAMLTAPAAQAERWPTTAGTWPISYVTPWDGRTRQYLLHLPSGFSPSDGTVRALVLALHGGGGTAPHFENSTGYSVKADTENFIVVYPSGVSNTWNASTECCGPANKQSVDDVRFLKDVVAQLSAQYAINPGKVFATGHSNGGVMSWRLGCDAANVFSAIGPNAADSTTLHPDGTACNLLGRRVRVVNLHGDADTSMPYYGGTGSGLEPYLRQPVEDPDPNLHGGQTDMGMWTALNGCSFTPVDTVTTPGYVKKTFCGMSGMQVVNYKVLGGEHRWFSTSNSTLSSTDVTWSFFASTPVTLFSDGFESGNFIAGGWSTTGSPVVTASAAAAGGYGARLRGTSSMTRQVNVVGYSSVTVEFSRRTSGLDGGEYLKVEWSTNGVNWLPVLATQDTNWAAATIKIPPGAAGQSELRVRFSTNADSLLERADIDSVRITGS